MNKIMKLLNLFVLLLLMQANFYANDTAVKDDIVFVYLNQIYHRQIHSDALLKKYQHHFKNYQPNVSVMKKLQEQPLSDLRFKIIFGTWCIDAEYGVPKCLKILDQLNIDTANIEMFGVDFLDSMHKANPKGMGKNAFVYRVPTMLIYDKEQTLLGKIVEYPQKTYERDLLAILSHKTYIPNYHYLDIITNWYKEGVLEDPNLDYIYLHTYLKQHIHSPNILISCAKYFKDAHKSMYSAIVILKINTILFPKNVETFILLGDYLKAINKRYEAFSFYKRALNIQGESEELVDKMLEVTTP